MLTETERYHLYITLGMSEVEIGDAKKGKDPEVIIAEQARHVLIYWRNKQAALHKKATRKAILRAFEKAKNLEKRDGFLKIWGDGKSFQSRINVKDA